MITTERKQGKIMSSKTNLITDGSVSELKFRLEKHNYDKCSHYVSFYQTK